MSDGRSHDVIYQRCLQLIKQHDFSGEALDFGAGRGAFSEVLWQSQKFQKVTGADLLPRPSQLPESIQWLHLDLNNETGLPSEAFDVVVALEVIEHLENPRLVARQWFEMLRPGGHLIMSTPNNESLRSLLALFLRGHFVSFSDRDYPAHITALLGQDLQRVLKEAGFKNIQTYYSESGVLPKFTNITWQTASFGLLGGQRFSDNVFVVAEKA
ncbi:MAG: methyltransferase domain-containing protein [Pseudobdellovibrionaceae bacterium]|nr:MAG: methyltransferase domain-containing protein [Pseudobdellovibrionaceae bacterium]